MSEQKTIEACRKVAAAKGYVLNVVPKFGIEVLGPNGKRYAHTPGYGHLYNWLRSAKCKPLAPVR